jgi:hypothetical protein
MKQEVNRKHAADKWALDDVVMTSEVTHPPKVRPTQQQPRSYQMDGLIVFTSTPAALSRSLLVEVST